MSKSFFDSPSIFVEPHSKSAFLDACDSSPFWNRVRLAFIFKVAIVALIICLSFISSPSAIVFVVAFAVIYSIKRMFGARSGSHIAQESFKRIDPSVTDFYTSASISFVSMVIWVKASLLHASPNFIFWNRSEPVSGKFISTSNCSNFFVVTTTRLNVPISKMSDVLKRGIAAIAKAFPFAFFLDVTNSQKPVKLLVSDVYESHICRPFYKLMTSVTH